MRVLAVGGGGYYSGMITRRLAEDFDITVFDVKGKKPDFSCRFIEGDVMDGSAITEACEGHDSVVCFFTGDAAISTVGMANLLTAAKKTAVTHVVYTSSGGMSYPIPALYESLGPERFSDRFWESYFPIAEERGLFPGLETTGYFLFKWTCEQLGIHFSRRGVKFTSIRPGNFMRDDMSCRSAERAKVVDHVHLLVSGHVTVRDSASLYKRALLRPPDSHAVCNLSNDTPYSALSVAKARTELGYRCKDPGVYYDFYEKQDWREAYRLLVEKGLPEKVLRKLYAFREL
jgi:nucleoside-diphosphate-sugar epimerase